jgi:hypothetical protein
MGFGTDGKNIVKFMNLIYILSLHRYACSLLRQGMKQITITLETDDIIALEKGGDKAAVTKVGNRNRSTKDCSSPPCSVFLKLLNPSRSKSFWIAKKGGKEPTDVFCFYKRNTIVSAYVDAAYFWFSFHTMHYCIFFFFVV